MPKKISQADLSSKVGKYILNRSKGMNKKKAAIAAGYADGAHTSMIENTNTFVALKRKYQDILQSEISLSDIAREHVKNILQDDDKSSKNAAIKMALEKIEPEDTPEASDENQMIVILRAK